MEWNAAERGGEGKATGEEGKGICVDVCVSEAYGDVFKPATYSKPEYGNL